MKPFRLARLVTYTQPTAHSFALGCMLMSTPEMIFQKCFSYNFSKKPISYFELGPDPELKGFQNITI